MNAPQRPLDAKLAEPGDSRAGRAALVFSRAASGDTYLSRQQVGYPYHICGLHRFAGDPAGMMSLYVQSCAGGIFQQDRLRQSFIVEEGALAHVTTTASTIVHGMAEGHADQEVRLQ